MVPGLQVSELARLSCRATASGTGLSEGCSAPSLILAPGTHFRISRLPRTGTAAHPLSVPVIRTEYLTLVMLVQLAKKKNLSPFLGSWGSI